MVTQVPEGVTLPIKVVPGATRSLVVGLLGDRVKICVNSPAEAGKANKAACGVLSKLMGTPRRAVTVCKGHTNPNKLILIEGVDHLEATERLAQALTK